MNKNYVLTKVYMLGLEMKKINYSFAVQKTNEPTKFIKVIVHHTGNSKTVQKIIDLHVLKNKWSQIGYHFMIGKRGQVYYSRDLRYAGAHTFGYNKNSIGIGLFGNFDEQEPTEEQIASLKLLVKNICDVYEIRKVLAHNEAIYDLIKKRYWKVDWSNLNLLDIKDKDEYKKFLKGVSTKVLESNADDYTVSLLKRLKTCPGINMYEDMKEIKKIKGVQSFIE